MYKKNKPQMKENPVKRYTPIERLITKVRHRKDLTEDLTRLFDLGTGFK